MFDERTCTVSDVHNSKSTVHKTLKTVALVAFATKLVMFATDPMISQHFNFMDSIHSCYVT